MGNFCDKSTETILHEIGVQLFLRFSDSSKPSQSLSLIYELAWLARIGKSVKNLLKTSCKVAPLTKVAHIFWWRHDNRKQSASARERWCNVGCDIPYWIIILSTFPLLLVTMNIVRHFQVLFLFRVQLEERNLPTRSKKKQENSDLIKIMHFHWIWQ